jgi:citrate synthase
LEGVVVADTSLGDVRGEDGFFHYREYSAVDLARTRSLEEVWLLLFTGTLPDVARTAAFSEEVQARRVLPKGLRTLLPELARAAPPLDVLRIAVSLLGAELGWRPVHDIDPEELSEQAVDLCALVPTVLGATWRLQQGLDPVEPDEGLDMAAGYLAMVTGATPDPEHARAIEQYMIVALDHGFSASTFTARVVTSTGADIGAAVVAALAALSGPLHGGAPSRALDMLDAIGTPEQAEPWLREAVSRGDRIMGFGHRVYKTDDPRSVFLRSVSDQLGGPMSAFARSVEGTAVDVLAELKPGRRLYTNVEFYAGVVMETCGIPREMFTPTFAAARTIGWCAHVMEQAGHNRLIRPAARYVGPPAPRPVPPLGVDPDRRG